MWGINLKSTAEQKKHDGTNVTYRAGTAGAGGWEKIIPMFATLIAVYVCAGFAGSAVIQTLYMKDKVRDLKPFTDFVSEMIVEDKFIRRGDGNFIIKAYDINGTELPLKVARPPKMDDDMFPDVHAGKIKQTAAQQWKPMSDSEIRSALLPYIIRTASETKKAAIIRMGSQKIKMMICGVPLIKNGTLTGSVFVIQPVSDFQTALNGFYLVFSVSVAAGLIVMFIFLYRYISEANKLEMMRREYISNISHELKSPLVSIKALSETLSDGMAKDEETRMRYYSIMINESNRLEKLVQDMLELSRLQNGKSVFNKEKVSPSEMMKEVELKYSVIADDMGITFVNSCPDNLPDVYTCRNRILQLFAILIDNALKYVPDDNGRIAIDAKAENGTIVFTVMDNGTGIPSADIPYIFDRFYKQDKSHSGSGSGLGLSIAKAICDGMKEEIAVSSNEGKGSVFSFTAAIA